MLYRKIIAVCSKRHTKHINTLCGQNVEFVNVFAKLRKATISFVTSAVRPHGTTRLPLDGIREILYLTIFPKCVEKNPASLKSDDNNGYYT